MCRVVGLALAGAVVLAGVPLTSAVAAPADGTLTVRVIRDVNGNGNYDPALEVGVGGIPVVVTAPGGATAKGTTGQDGVVKIDLGPVAGDGYRVQATIPASMPHLKPAPAGNGLSSLTEFVSGPNPSVTMGVWNPADYCQSTPALAVACERNTRKAGAQGEARSVVSVPFAARGTTPTPTRLAKQADTGSVYGLAYRRQDKRLFSAAFAKRFSPYGPGGSGAIYATKAGVTTQFATVPGSGATQHSGDDESFVSVPGKESLGDIMISEDGTALYTVNLANKTLYVYDATVPTASAPVALYPVPNPGCPNATDWRPAALGGRDGVVYVGGVCDGQSTNKVTDMKAVVLPFRDNAFGPAVLSRTLDFERGAVVQGGETHWHPWTDKPPDQGAASRLDPASRSSVAQPLLANIAVENDGDLVLGFRDRFGDQVDDAVVGGDVNRACRQGDGTFVWEGTGSCPNNHKGAADGESASVAEFYPGEYFKTNAETAMGAVALVPGADRMPATVMDPLADDTSGVGWFDRTTGTMQNDKHSNGFQVMSDPQEGWSTGLGDLEALCDLAPVQLGNRVWFDQNTNGFQDGDEPALPGVKVTATPCVGGAALPSKTTNAKGEYAFATADGLKPDTCYNLKFDLTGATTSVIPGAPPGSSLRWTAKGAGPDRAADSNVDPRTGLATVTLGPAGSVDTTVDAGVVAPTNTVGDYVWADLNRNGQQDAGEPPVPGLTVSLGDRKTVTGLDGKYLFGTLPDGTYSVCVDLKTLPASFVDFQATRMKAGDDARDSDIDPDTGCAPPVTLAAADAENMTMDAGLVPPANRIGDLVWTDLNHNGLQDPGEPGLPDVPVALGDKKTFTGKDGRYEFSDMPDGTYTVCFGHYSDFVFTTPKTGDDQKDSDADPVSGCAPPVTLAPGNRSVTSIDAGFTVPPNKLGDFVWNDLNRNGLQDPSEPGVPDVPVTVGNLRTTTGPDGKYVFDNMPDGPYTVCFDLKKAGDFQATKPNVGDDGLDSDADPATGCSTPVTLGANHRSDMTVDAGVATPVNRLGDLVWTDANHNGVQDPGEPGMPGVTVMAGSWKTVTGADGKYLFEGMPDGTYTVCVDVKTLPTGYTLPKSSVDAVTGCAPAVSVSPDHREVLTIDVGLVPPPDTVGDFVWNDVNHNGVQDAGEPGIAGVTVTVGSWKTVTGADGKYVFPDLTDGTYTVCFGRKDDLQFTKPHASERERDSDADPATGCAAPVTLGVNKRSDMTIDAGMGAPVNRVGGTIALNKAAGVPGVTVTAGGARTVTGPDGKYLLEGLPDGTGKVCFAPPLGDPGGCAPDVTLGPGHRENLAVDFTFMPPPNKLGDFVWLDSNRDGVQDAGEPGIAGVTVTAGNAKTVTGPDGKYVFDGLPDGDYRVCFDLKAGYLPTAQGKSSSALPDGCVPAVTLGAGSRSRLDVDLGIRPPNTLGDRVWVDTNRDGVQDPGEPGVAGVQVRLTAGPTTKTDNDGKYLFNGLADGLHTVCFDRTTLPTQYALYQLTKGPVDQSTWCAPPTRLFAGKYEDLTQDVGIVPPANRIGDRVWIDTDRDGMQDPTESGAPGVTVLLRSATGAELSRTVTDRFGAYLFDSLDDGLYVVCVVPTDLKGYTIGSGVDKQTGCGRPVTVGPSAREVLTVDIGLLPPKALASTGASVGWLVTGGVAVLALGLLLLLYRRNRT
ncbi:SdrD B-like domain-containing protein [Actinocrispum wychmicini]|uniref:LPXTG-motif cell wall-anchored protein n=1 Tax=Actinocrispum wychmicini TaxID=1213861 RepID=A0A4R2K5D4_9PSEU|nr:SdrD B-like domain-containing protein [Actinocrispum wychmicini]TCO65056.1 LPXTG-motif cell wall-anchored protein [Actinocrispum wychmicini]